MFLFVVLVLCEFVVGNVYSEVETSFVIMSPENDGLGFWGMNGDYLIASTLVLVVVLIYLNAIKGPGKKRGK